MLKPFCHLFVNRPVSFESVDGQLLLLHPIIEIAIQRFDKLHPSLNIFKLREVLETRSKSKMSHPPIHHLHSRETQGRLHRIRPLRRQTKLDPLELHLIIILLQYCILCVGIISL